MPSPLSSHFPPRACRRALVSVALFSSALTAQQPRQFTLFAHKLEAGAGRPYISADGRRAYVSVEGSLVVRDLVSGRRAVLVSGGVGKFGFAESPRGDRVAFPRRAEGAGDREHIWSVGVDLKSLRATGAPKRVSLSTGTHPAFAPDGNQIAFAADDSGETRRLVVVPGAGGAERVIDSPRSGIYPISWASDGKTLYYSVGSSETRGTGPALMAVAAGGGAPRKIVDGRSIGVSADGRFTALKRDVPDAVQRDVSIINMRTLKPVATFRTEQWPQYWVGNTIAAWNGYAPLSLHLLSLRDGSRRTVSDAEEMVCGPSWSPDGSRFIVRTCGEMSWTPSGPVSTYRLYDAAGRKQREWTVKRAGGESFGPYWSPDGRWIAGDGGTRTVLLTEVATGREVVHQLDGIPETLHWSADSRTVSFSIVVTPVEQLPRKRELVLVSTSGSVQKLGVASGSMSALVNDSLALLRVTEGVGRRYFVRNVRDASPERPAFSFDTDFWSLPTSIPGTNRLLFRHGANRDEMRKLRVTTMTGATEQEIDLPFNAQLTSYPLRVIAGGRQVIVPGWSAARDSIVLHSVDLQTKAVRRLQAFPASYATDRNGVSISPDGSSALYLVREPGSSRVNGFDITPLLAGRR